MENEGMELTGTIESSDTVDFFIGARFLKTIMTGKCARNGAEKYGIVKK